MLLGLTPDELLATTRSVRKRLDLTRPVEREAAEILGIPFEKVMQAALIPVAYTVGTDFRPHRPPPAGRDRPLGSVVGGRAAG
jgi:hypothetical protein